MNQYREIQRTDKLLFICPFCGLAFKALAYHTRQRHKVTAKDLRKMFGLKANYQLITPNLKARHKQIAIDNNEGEKLKRVGKKTRFVNGHIGHIKENWSNQAIEELKRRVTK